MSPRVFARTMRIEIVLLTVFFNDTATTEIYTRYARRRNLNREEKEEEYHR